MIFVDRRKLLVTTGIALVGVIAVFGHLVSAADERRGVVGVSQRGGSAVEYIGVIEQNGPSFTAIGYLTHVQGLDPADLFTDPGAPGAATARFTFSGAASVVSHAQVGNVTQIGAAGTLKIYFSELGGADFADPSSFTTGTEVGAYDARFHNILAVIAPSEGVASATADAVQRSARSFRLDGKELKLGHKQLAQRLTLSGRGTRTQVDPPISKTEFAASATTR